MAPKTKFDRESVINTAFDIASKEGFSAVTARSIAKRLGSSVAPIYVNFETLDDLIDEVVKRVFSLSENMLKAQEGRSYFEKVGKASLEFAKRYPVFFRELLLKPNKYTASYEETEDLILYEMSKDNELKGLDKKELKLLLLKMRIFQLGLSTMAANSSIPSWIKSEEFDSLLFNTADELIYASKKRKDEI